tara:strand:- start:389 stop:1333 length:945 start_codon:yes stop_codon:yes gene_type:complete
MNKIIYLFPLALMFVFSSCDPDENANPNPNEGPDTITVDSLKINRKVLIVGIDGFRSDVMQESMTPFMFNLQDRNNYHNLTHQTEEITYSGPNWSSMLTGVHQNKHNVLDNSFQNDNYSNYPPFFHYLHEANVGIQTASLVNWSPINIHILAGHADYAPESSMNDATVFENAKQILLEQNPLEADVLFLQFDELDGAGHEYGFSPTAEEYVNTATILDTYASDLFDIIENKRANGEDWMFIIISDHGGEGTSHSDGEHSNVNTTIFFAEHPDMLFKANCCYFSNQTDLGPTVLDFLGISSLHFENNTDGNSIIE